MAAMSAGWAFFLGALLFVIGFVFVFSPDNNDFGSGVCVGLMAAGAFICICATVMNPYVTDNDAQLQFVKTSGSANVQMVTTVPGANGYLLNVNGEGAIGFCTPGNPPMCYLGKPFPTPTATPTQPK
ncbi:hypothetical protein C5B42_05055 [Candidatus Cerribacteria bacterium 'Amazon FNV 2010 28 9']|uniref:Uncharacterized protein n=1 Tax=Candidatus Cerribacteria bacterium 'Amazon FNV 2010 28 9' TaxID=2081795 RepID=A0A317JMS6_9BACT|nr:MAG: hypothetical protein C5B42_05055 [Candidatus Cerribacteria bacterium 'Amazon FNV 2010 28 9']